MVLDGATSVSGIVSAHMTSMFTVPVLLRLYSSINISQVVPEDVR